MSTDDDLTIRRVHDPAEVERGYRDLIEPSFPPSELTGLEDHLRVFGTGELDVWHAESGGVAVGCATVTHVDGGRHRLLGYLAVSEKARSGGVGGRLLGHVISEHRGTVDHLYAEIENPDRVPDTEREDAERRHTFYRRFDAHVLDVPYVLPGQPGADRLTDLDLCVIPTGPDVTVSGTVDPVVPLVEVLGFLVAHHARTGDVYDAQWTDMVAGTVRGGDGRTAGIRPL